MAIAAAPPPPMRASAREQFIDFTKKQFLSCVFPIAVMAALALSYPVARLGIPRYDFILFFCLLVQFVMYRTGMESKDELKVIAVFHLFGLMLEQYKTRTGSWEYPEFAWTKIGTVPLYSGFMYASVASYMCQAWRRLDLQLTDPPAGQVAATLAAAVYVNFFTERYLHDWRWVLAALILIVFWRTRVWFTVADIRRRMPLSLAFAFIGFFIWIAENLGTLLGGWRYPNQHGHWHMVMTGKISSWCLLVIISFIAVAQLKHVKEGLTRHPRAENAR